MAFRTPLLIFDLIALFQDGTKPRSSRGNSTELHSVSYSNMLEKLVMEKDKKFVAFAEEVRNYSCSFLPIDSFFCDIPTQALGEQRSCSVHLIQDDGTL